MIRAFWIGFAIVFATAVYVIKIGHRMPDFEVYRTTAIRAQAAEPLYRESDGHWQFKYLPAFAIAVVPLGFVPDDVARALWFAGSVLLLAWLPRLTLDVLPERRHTAGLLVGATFVLLGKFYAHELELGQVNILMTFLVVAAVWH